MQSGETLSEIARAYGRSETQLARVNGIDSPQTLTRGSRLFIPGATSIRRTTSPGLEKGVIRAADTAPLETSRLPVRPKEVPPSVGNRTGKGSGGISPPDKPAVSPGQFVWPAQGHLHRRFGDQKPFPCKGIELAIPTGSPVLAAAAGRVIYSGDGISSFGNMIILRHDRDFYTVYAFLQKNMVKVGSFVSQKERIALSGLSPQRGTPLLYFELRHHKEPVDPTFYLP